MLKTPALPGVNNPILAIMSGGKPHQVLEEGVIAINHHNLELMIGGGRTSFEMGYPDIPGVESYGVCDSPEQFLAAHRETLQKDVRTFVVGFTHVAKNPDNKGNGGGWRWHKWGPYIGTGSPQCEYLDDEPGFDAGVHCYHIAQTDGPVLVLDDAGNLVPKEG